MTRYVAIIEERPSGFGPTIWVGELRTDHDDQPVPSWRAFLGGGSRVSERRFYGAHAFWPVTFGATEEDVLAKLTARARGIVGSASVTRAKGRTMSA